MKLVFTSLLALAGTAVALPAAAPAADGTISFPITDLLNTDIAPEDHLAELKSSTTIEPALEKRQTSGNTLNQLKDGTPCRAVTLIYARGTNQDGNVGPTTAIGPVFFGNITALLGTGKLAVQGVDYAANVLGFLAGGDPAATPTMSGWINTAASKCPSTKIVVSGYSQGAQVAHNAVNNITAAVAARISAVVVFGDPKKGQAFKNVATSKVLTVCHTGDNICDGGIIVTDQHTNYQKDAPTAAQFVVSKV